MQEREAYIALNMMEKVGPVSVRSLSAALGSARAIFEAEPDDLTQVRGIGRELAHSITSQRDTVDWAGELERAERSGARIVTAIDEDYPRRLKDLHDPPLALYVRGILQSRDEHALAVVGTRRPTHYGRACAEQLAAGLARTGFTVVSGLAEGIDTVAHDAALKAKGRTIAVLGGALDCLYPPSNEGLAGRIAESGAVMTEYAFGRQPDKTTFPVRNRIVSGLSMGVLVVEAGEGSGAMITAGQAAEQGRTVFAVPGRIDSSTARGPHKLIRDGARLVEKVEDVLEEFEFLIPPRASAPAAGSDRPRPALSEEESRVLAMLQEGEIDVDSIIRGTGLAPSSVNALLIGLEMKRLVRMLPGRMVAATR